jgi:hypothetical protein
MPFSDVREKLILIDEQVDTVEHDLPFLEEIEAPAIYPSDPQYFIRVYYDASRFRSEHALQDLFDRMQAQYTQRRIGLVDLDPKSFEYRSLSPFPKMEKLFSDRGFVADVEGRVFRKGQVASTLFAKRNVDAVTGNAMVMAALLEGPGHDLLPQAEGNETRDDLVIRVMAPVMGKENISRPQESPPRFMIYPLAEHKGLLLGCTDFSGTRRLHWAFETTPKQAIDQGGRQSPRDSLFKRKMELVRNQILFEAQNGTRLLGPEHLDPVRPHCDVTETMIITWYSQAIAAMRKVCWLVSAEQETSVVAHSLTQEKALHGRVIGAPNLPENERSWDQFIEDQVDRRNEEIAELAQDWGPIRGPIDLTCKIAWDDELLAAMMGATYRSDTDLSESPYQNPDIFVRCVAYWIGSLKRKRTATIDWYTAEGILEVCRGEYSSTLLLSQFPKATWVELEEIAEAIVNGGPVTEVEVRYTWTRDLNAPYKCEERDGMLVLEGPLLCFPSLAADEWRVKAQTIRTLRGFEVKGGRRR